MTKNTDYHLDLTTATPAALQGYILSAGFDEWLKKLSDQDLLDAERAFERASIKAANYRFCRAHLENARISGTALAHGFGGGKSATFSGVRS